MKPRQETSESYPVRLILAVLAVQVLLLLLAAWQNRFSLNTDAVAYLRLASYYAQGQTDLMISGYWGPLLSWLIALLLKLGLEPLAAARLVMGLSALLFAVGNLALLRSLGLPRSAVLAGLALAGLASVSWSVENISPDLLVSALLCLATSQLISASWLARDGTAILAGALWGLAYLAKAIALPLAFGVSVGLAGLWAISPPMERKLVSRRLAVTLLTCGVVAAPWIALLSVKYGHPTFSTTARIAHAVVGPPDVERYHPFVLSFHKPEPGRLTSWEDPSRMAYQYWSPFASSAYFRHQLRLMVQNGITIARALGEIDPVHIGLLAILGSACLAWPRVRGLNVQPPGREQWWWVGVPFICLIGIYLPVYVQPMDQRYFYAALPLLFGAAAGLLLLVARCWPSQARLVLRGGWTLVGASFFLPALIGTAFAVQGLPNPASACARELAERLSRARVTGSIAGSGLVAGGRAGLYLAFLQSERWHGDMPNPTAADFRGSGARLVIVNRRQPVSTVLDHDAGFLSLDDRLFASTDEAERFPLKVFLNRAAP